MPLLHRLSFASLKGCVTHWRAVFRESDPPLGRTPRILTYRWVSRSSSRSWSSSRPANAIQHIQVA